MTKSNKDILPVHLGLILDGNRRWAKANGLPQMEGHRRGYENLQNIALEAINVGVKYVSAFVFSTYIWNRSKEEVSYLMKLLLWVAKTETKRLDKEGIRVRFAGSRSGVNKQILKAIDEAEEKTKDHTRGTVIFCFNYGGQNEIVDAARRLLRKKVNPDTLTSQMFADSLYVPSVPEVDLIVRTSGEYRLSGFMLWRAAYAELMFVDKHWPEFSKQDLAGVLKLYAKRQRRFGK
jgi:undecaprenyl diphosphate synthase